MKKISMRIHINLILLAVFIIMLIVVAYFLRIIMLDGLNELEDKYVKEHAERVEKQIDEKLFGLQQIAKDYAAWDDSYEYIADHNEEFETNNLTEETFINLDLDIIVYLDQAGQFVFANAMDFDSGELIPIYEGLQANLQKSGLFTNFDEDRTLHGIMRLDEGLVLLVSYPIIKSDYSGPARGNLVLGQLLDLEAIDEIEESLNLNITIQRLDGKHDAIFDGFADAKQTIVDIKDRNTILAYSMLKDVFQRPVAGIIVNMGREFSAVGRSALNYLVAALAIVIVFALALVAFSFDKLVLARLKRLSEDVSVIGDGNSNSYHLSNDFRNDEISIVGDAINSMLEKLEKSKTELAAGKEKYRKFVENGRDIVFSVDFEGVITYISPNCKEIIGYSDNEIIGKPFMDLIHPDSQDGWSTILKKANEQCRDFSGYEFLGKCGNGLWQWFRTDVSLLVDDNQTMSLMGIFYNINESKMAEFELVQSHANLENEVKLRTGQLVEANEELSNEITIRKQIQEKVENLAYYDTLTGLPNRALLVDRIHQAVDLGRRLERPIGILFLDLDGFKTVNDTFGHFQGDELLKAVACRLAGVLRKSDTVARMGGDEFIIMAPNIEDAKEIETVANKIINVFKNPFDLSCHEIYTTASIGISVFPADGETADALIKNADLAMYKAKEKGRNQYVFCTRIMKDIITENMKLSNGLYRALGRDELEIYYQPQVNRNTKKIVGLEALLRWNNPEFGLVSPGRFIHLAEQTGLINPIGRWVLYNVCKQNKAWQEAGLPHVRIAVNLSIIQFQSPGIVNQVKEILEETNLEPQYLELEITESIAMRDTEYIIRVLNEFKALGIYISIDDFGTEFSSLNYLKLLPINRIKIPMPFIQGIAVNDKDEAITKTIIALAKNMGLDVIAEGVETQQQEAFLMRLMCNEMQGFYYYKPLGAPEIEAVMQN